MQHDTIRRAIERSAFLLKHRDAVEKLMLGRLFDGKAWRNAASHCIQVALALDAAAMLLQLPEHDRAALVNVGFVHDWNKRLSKDPSSFSNDERREIEAKVAEFLRQYDPHGHLLNATEVEGLDRLEGNDGTIGEHLVHFFDLSCLPEGLVAPEKRFADLRSRHLGKGYEKETEEFWTRKEHLVRKEEHMILERMRSLGVTMPDDAHLCDVIDGRLRGV